ncbi:HSF-type DNA-binding domain containing protein [Russula decolorans]
MDAHYPHTMSPTELPYSSQQSSQQQSQSQQSQQHSQQQPQRAQQSQQSQQQQQQSQQQPPAPHRPQRQPPPSWPSGTHLLPAHAPSYSSTPSTPSLGDPPPYGGYFQPPGQAIPENMMERSALSLNLSSLSVTSPTNLSPINPSPLTSTATSGVSPITPLSPSTLPNGHHTPFGAHHQFHSGHQQQQQQQQPPSQFSFGPPDNQGGVRFESDPAHNDLSARRVCLSSRSSSSSDKSVPRKRSFTAGTSLPANMEERMFDALGQSMDIHTPASYDEVEMGYPSSLDPNGSPIDEATSDEQDDLLKPLDGQVASPTSHVPSSLQTNGGSMNVIGKPIGTNNFVTKLYQMINDPKSAHFISWTELGTSFVVSNVGEFSRTILGSHFKHNNFSSFVRQLNMYGFHKINRTPRAQRTSTDAQTWEFSHHKFLRARPDLLEEIKRKALEPDPSIKHRVELPGEVAAQLAQMREDNRRVVNALAIEKAKTERLTILTKALYDAFEKNYPGWLPPFPADLADPDESPNIYVTQPTTMAISAHAHFPPSALPNAASLHSLSPASSPTTTDFPPTGHIHNHPHSLSRQHSFPHNHTHSHAPYGTSPSPVPMDFEDAQGRKRQRTAGGVPPPPASSAGTNGVSPTTPVGVGADGTKQRLARARSDSAPLGYNNFGSSWTATRPRSGSGLAVRAPRREDIVVPSIGSVARAVAAASQPILPPMGSLAVTTPGP